MGSASAQVVLVTPLLVLCLMLVFQFALHQHASHVVTASAQDAAEAAEAEAAGADHGRHAGWSRLATNGTGLLRNVSVEVDRSGEHVRAHVTADVVSLVPGFTFRVSAISGGPVERFRNRTDR